MTRTTWIYVVVFTCISVLSLGGTYANDDTSKKVDLKQVQFIFDQYMDWLKNNGVEDFTLINLKVSTDELGRPSITTTAFDDIGPNNVPISIPNKLILSGDNIANEKVILAADDFRPGLPDKLKLIFYIVSAQLRDSGRWKPYFRVLQFFESSKSVINWENHHLGALDGVASHMVQNLKANQKKVYENILEPLALNHPDLFPKLTLRDFEEAHMLVERKMTQYATEDGQLISAIIPVISELPTASQSPRIRPIIPASNSSAFAVSVTKIPAGDEVTMPASVQSLASQLVYSNTLSNDPTTDYFDLNALTLLPADISAAVQAAGHESLQIDLTPNTVPTGALNAMLQANIDRKDALIALRDGLQGFKSQVYATTEDQDEQALEVVAKATDFDATLYNIVNTRLREKQLVSSVLNALEKEIEVEEQADEIDEL